MKKQTHTIEAKKGDIFKALNSRTREISISIIAHVTKVLNSQLPLEKKIDSVVQSLENVKLMLFKLECIEDLSAKRSKSYFLELIHLFDKIDSIKETKKMFDTLVKHKSVDIKTLTSIWADFRDEVVEEAAPTTKKIVNIRSKQAFIEKQAKLHG